MFGAIAYVIMLGGFLSLAFGMYYGLRAAKIL